MANNASTTCDIVCEDRCKVTMHGKDVADEDGAAVSGKGEEVIQ